MNLRKSVRMGVAGLILLFAALLTAQAAAEPPTAKWKLVWSDEFDGENLDKTKWDFDIGNGFSAKDSKVWVGGWGNDELEYYTSRPENVWVKDGMLHVRALKESYEGFAYTSARLKTRKKDGDALFAKKYGRFEFRAKLPTGKGIWPALWLLPQDEKYGGWAASGEIDIMEARGQEPYKVLGTLHFGSAWPGNAHVSKDYVLPQKGSIAEFHVYALEWEPGEIRWYVDDHLYSTQRSWWSRSKPNGGNRADPRKESDLNPWPAPFDQPFYIVMNLAVGGRFLGNPDRTTVFPAEMTLDYVRAYDKIGGYEPPRARGARKPRVGSNPSGTQ
jgi:beta-glucanase (GH16 family)